MPLDGPLDRGETVLVERHVDHARHSGGGVRGEHPFHGVVALGIRRRGVALRPRVLHGRRLEQHPVRFAVGVAADLAAERIGGVARDAELGQCGGVHPAGVVVVGIQVDRHVAGDGVDHRRSRRTARHRIEQPPATAEDQGVGIGGAGLAQEILDAVEGARVGQGDLAERLAHHEQVRVRVGEPGEHERSVEVDDLVRADRGVGADRDDRLALDREGVGPLPGRVGIGREDPAAPEERTGHADTSAAWRSSRRESRPMMPAGTASTKLAIASVIVKPWYPSPDARLAPMTGVSADPTR